MSARNILLKLFTSGVLALVVLGLIGIIRSQKVIAAVGVNKIINFQGKVTNANGTNVTDGTYDFVIKLYDGAASGSTNTYTESWTAAALWSSTMSVAPTAGQESLTYSSNTNESTIKVGQVLWNVTKEEPVVVVGVNTGTNVITISPTRQTWATGDTVTNKVYVKDGTFKVAINSLNQDLSAVNFGTDNIFLGINFNADGEMKPRIQYTATPYAMNADKVNGLTVTNTSDAPFTSVTTLKIADGKTVIISNGLTFSGTDSTSFTFPSTGGNVVTEAFTQSLTNKTIGSTGLTFSGATTDITTGVNEDFVISPNGTGKIGLGTFSTGPFGFFDVRSPLGTSPAASISAISSFASLMVDQAGVGDLFTASKSGAMKFVINNAGNVGIGTNLPTQRLDVAGNTSIVGTLTGLTGLTLTSGPITLGGGTGSGQCLVGGASAAWGSCGAGSSQWTTTGNNIYYTTGNVGIGTTLPAGLLQISGSTSTAQGAALVSLNQTGTADIFTASKSGVTKFVINNDGNVGIGTTAPEGLLQVNGAATGKSLSIFNQLTGGDQDLLTASQAGVTKFKISNTGAASMSGALTFGDGTATNNVLRTPYGPLLLQYKSAANTWATGLYLQDVTGNIGIGSTSPAQKLDVAGSAVIAGNLTGLTGLTLASGAITLGGGTGSGQCITGGATAAWGSCGGGGGGPTYLDQVSGLTFVGNTTTDFAIGGNSTSSAKFIFGTMSTGTPTATFSGDLIIDNKPSTANADMQRWTKITGTAGTVGGGTAGVASISASVVYNGSLYVGTSNANSAEIYRYNGDALGTWTKVSGTTGTVGGNATTAIDMISSLIVYNGYLYAGTTEADKAEVYRYNGGSSWTQLNAGGVAGTLLSTTLIDGIPSMAVFGGRLFIGTREVTKAQIYMYNGGSTWIAVNGTAGTFVATNSIGMDAITQMVVLNNQLVVGTLKGGDSDVLRWNGIVGGSPFFALNLASTTGSYLIDNAAQTGTNEITAMTVWAGKLVIAIRRAANQADILMYQEPPGGAAPINSWTRLNSATGTIGTANINSVNAMTTYAGRLYVGTTEPDGAEVYRYDDSKAWTKVSQNSAGRVAAGGTSSIDSISTLISYNHNSLFAGTQEGTSAEGYSYSVSIDQSYSLKFHAGSSQGGGEQNNNENLGQIFFVASLSANLNNKAGNTGSFVFSHSIVTNNGSYDVAEDYPTRDDTLEPGDIVSIDPNERGFVKKSEGDYDYTAIGVYSEKPALRLSQEGTIINGGRAIPVALAGRVPVKVSAENGDIELGDPLTPSSIPGVAMKARKSGLIIGQAMEGYSGDGIGKVMTFIKSSSYTGSIAESFLGIDKESSTLGQDILNALESQNNPTGSEVVTDKVVAGLEIIAPIVTTRKLFTNNLSIMKGDQLSVDLGENGKVVFKGRGSEGIVFDDKGNAIFAGSIQAKSIKAERIEGLEIITGQVSSLNQIIASLSATLYKSEIATEVASAPAELSETNSIALTSIDSIFSSLGVTGVATFSGDVRVKGSGLIEGILSIVDTLTTNQLFVNGLATFFETTVFKKDVQFEGRPIVNKDTAGLALIKKGDKSVGVIFEKEFESMPIINANLVIDKLDDEKDQEEADASVFDQNRDFVITHRSKKGFVILLREKADEDLQFSWTSIMVKDPFLFRSDLVHTLSPPE